MSFPCLTQTASTSIGTMSEVVVTVGNEEVEEVEEVFEGDVLPVLVCFDFDSSFHSKSH